MDPLKLKLLQEVLDHLSSSQGKDLKSLLDQSKSPSPLEGSPAEEALESPKDELAEDGKPKGIAIEKVSLMDKKPESFNDKANAAIAEVGKKPGSDDAAGIDKALPGEDEMSDSELEELLKKYLS